MSSAFVQMDCAGAAAVTSESVVLNVTAGNVVALVGVLNGSKLSAGTVGTSSTGSETFSKMTAELDSSGTYTTVYLSNAVTGGSTTYGMTFNSIRMTLYAIELATILTSGAEDSGATATTAFGGTTSHAIGPSGALSQAVEFMLAIWNADGAGNTGSAPSVDTGFTIPSGLNGGNQLQGTGNGVAGARSLIAYLDTTSAAAVGPVTATTGSSGMSGLLIALKTSVVGVTSFNPVIAAARPFPYAPSGARRR